MGDTDDDICIISQKEMDNGNNTEVRDIKVKRILDIAEVKKEPTKEYVAVAKVFEHEMLREMILSYLVFSKTSLPSFSHLRFRLVNKSWLHSVSSLFLKAHRPLFHFTLEKENSSHGTSYTQQHGKLLDEFVSSTIRWIKCSSQIVPPFSLQLRPSFFRDENYRSLSDCLLKCGVGLISLKIQFPFKGSLPLIFPPFTLPNLQNFSVEFSSTVGQGMETKTGFERGNAIYPLQTILNASSMLKSLQFLDNPAGVLIPFGFKYLTLPQSLTKLQLNCKVGSSDLDFLAENALPNLEELRLFAPNVSLAEGLTFRILNNLRRSLQSLQLRGKHYLERVETANRFHFPIMEKLKVLQICGQSWELEEGLSGLETQLPSLESLTLTKVTEAMFQRFTDNSVYFTVKHVSVYLIDLEATESRRIRVETVPLTLTLENMQRLDIRFPKVSSLDIVLCGMQQSGLVYLFEHLGRLEKLKISVKDDHSGEGFHADCWDATMIGAPLELVTVLKNCPDYWSNILLKDDFVSVRDLTALKSFTLLDDVTFSHLQRDNNIDRPLVSDITFHFAFMKMPALEELQLSGNFSGSTEMMSLWKSQNPKRGQY